MPILLVKIGKYKTHKTDAVITIRDCILCNYNEEFSTNITNVNVIDKYLIDINNKCNMKLKEMFKGNDTQKKDKYKLVKKFVRLRPHNTTHERNVVCT